MHVQTYRNNITGDFFVEAEISPYSNNVVTLFWGGDFISNHQFEIDNDIAAPDSQPKIEMVSYV